MQGSSSRFAAFGLAVALALPVSAQTPPPAAVDSIMTTRVDSEIKIDPSGALVDYRSETPLPENVRANLEKQVRGWRFEPVLVQGQPVTARARMRITLAARDIGNEQYAVSVDNVTFPANDQAVMPDAPAPVTSIQSRKMGAPAYPRELAMAGVSSMVLVYLRLSPEGRVLEAVPVQTSLFNAKGSKQTLAKGVTLFERASVRAARDWQFEVKLHGQNPSARDLTVSIPIEYYAPNHRETRPGQWRTEVRGERREAAWLRGDAQAQRIGVSDLTSGELLPLASAVRLTTEVKGVAL